MGEKSLKQPIFMGFSSMNTNNLLNNLAPPYLFVINYASIRHILHILVLILWFCKQHQQKS